MPRVRAARVDCQHDGQCNCVNLVTGTEQTLEEMSFERSLCAAAQLGNESKVLHILERRPEEVSRGTRERHLRLTVALRCIDADRPIKLVAMSAGQKGGYTALHYASREGRLGIVQLLLRHGVLCL